MTSLVHGRLVRRYKRFLADVVLDSGKQITAHCPNTGSMRNCIEEGADVWLSRSDRDTRKYPHTWELTRTSAGHYICVNTSRANAVVEQGIRDNVVVELSGYDELHREVRYGDEGSRIDLLLSGHGRRPDCYVEVKSVTLLETPKYKGIGYFPDAVSQRGAKHLRELERESQAGNRAVLLFCVQHSGVREVRPADHIDPDYGTLLRCVAAAGVEVIAYKSSFAGRRPRLAKRLPVVLDP